MTGGLRRVFSVGPLSRCHAVAITLLGHELRKIAGHVTGYIQKDLGVARALTNPWISPKTPDRVATPAAKNKTRGLDNNYTRTETETTTLSVHSRLDICDFLP